MYKNQIDTEINDKELIAYVLEEASDRSERVLKALDEMIANINDEDITKP